MNNIKCEFYFSAKTPPMVWGLRKLNVIDLFDILFLLTPQGRLPSEDSPSSLVGVGPRLVGSEFSLSELSPFSLVGGVFLSGGEGAMTSNCNDKKTQCMNLNRPHVFKKSPGSSSICDLWLWGTAR